MKSYLPILLICFAVISASTHLQAAGEVQQGQTVSSAGYAELVSLFDRFMEWKDPENTQRQQIMKDRAGQDIEPQPDYSASANEKRQRQIKQWLTRIIDLDTSEWSVP